MLKFTAISGTIGVTENCYLYEYGDDMIMVDCGVGFPGMEMQGVDLVIPDFSYVVQNKHKLKGIFLSQGHEDHYGALPFLLQSVNAPIYAAPLVISLLQDKFADYGTKNFSVHGFDPTKDVITAGVFKLTPFRVSHSIPETLGYAIDTPEGRVMHVAEHKFDPDPVVGKPFDEDYAKRLASSGVKLLVSDSLGSNHHGSTPPEKPIEDEIRRIVTPAKGSIFFSCISSNMSRMQQAIDVAEETNRRVVFVGRSVQRKVMIAKEMGFMHFDDHLEVTPKKAATMRRNELMYIVAGSFGQVNGSLVRIATGAHKFIAAAEGDTAILASNPGPPYSKEAIDFAVDSFIDMGVDTFYYDVDDNLHVSGHGGQADIVKLFDMVKPTYFIPVGGTIRFMESYKRLAVGWGAKPENVFKLKPGDSVEFSQSGATKGKSIRVRDVLVDGLGVGDVGKVVLEDRQSLSENGIAVVLVKADLGKAKLLEDPEIISRGFVFQKQHNSFLVDSAKALRKELETAKKFSPKGLRYMTVEFLGGLFFKETGRRPMILPVIVEA